MSVSVGRGEPYPGCIFTLSQHLYAIKVKLRDSAFGGRVATTMNQVEVDRLEQDALEVLGLVRSMKNKFVPVGRIPGAVLSLIPNYWERRYIDTDKDLVALTHVCRGWRELFTSHPSLWTRLDFTNVDKTQAYIKRSRSLPLEVTICNTKAESSLEEALLLAIPHIKRFKSLTIVGTSDPLQNLTKHLTLPAPFLKEVTIDFNGENAPALDKKLLDGDLSSLRTLNLGGVVTNLPWKNPWNLTTFKLRCVPDNITPIASLLSFLESAPQLRDITLYHSIPTSSNASSSRVVLLPKLKILTIHGGRTRILLNHLSIPEGASLVLDFNFRGEKSPFSRCLPKTKNLKNLFRVTTINVHFDGFDGKKFVRLVGPSGGLYIFGHWERGTRETLSLGLDHEILQSLNYFPLHMTQSLTITKYAHLMPLRNIEEYPVYQILLRMKDLHTLTLIQSFNSEFIFALNPSSDPSKVITCPNLKKLVLYVGMKSGFNISTLEEMAKERASRGVKLRSITIVGLGELLPGREVFRLKKHVEHVEYRFEENSPSWDSIPDGGTDQWEG